MYPNLSASNRRVRERRGGSRASLSILPGLACVMLAAWLSGCTNPTLIQARYDMGVPESGHVATQAHAAAVVVPDVSAPADLDSDRIRFRYAYLNDQQTASYAASRWAMTPAQMMTQRLRTKLAAVGPILANPGASPTPTLRVELTRFEQVFTQPDQGQGVVNLRATLTREGVLIAQRDFYATAPAPTPDAAGGVRALARASDSALDALAVWYESQPKL